MRRSGLPRSNPVMKPEKGGEKVEKVRKRQKTKTALRKKRELKKRRKP